MRRHVWLVSFSFLACCGATEGAPEPARTEAPVVAPPSTEPGPQVPSSTAPPPYDALYAALPSATAIHMTTRWMGLSPIAPIEHHYDLSLALDAMSTQVVCGAAGQTHELPPGSVPMASIAPILARLATAPITPGPYVPSITHTDDYPDDSLVIDTPAGSLTFHTTSQSQLGDPWEIAAAGSSAVIDSRVPGEAYRDLSRLIDAERCSAWAQTVHR